MTKADLERWHASTHAKNENMPQEQATINASRAGFRAALELLWPCVQQLQSCEKYLDMLGYIPADSRQRELSEDIWEVAMWERDKAYQTLAELEGRVK